MNPAPDPFLRERYDQLWAQSSERIRAGTIEIDPFLARPKADQRRGMTLVFRPSQLVQERIAECLEELRGIEPDQYYYHPTELHVTFLSLFSATEDHQSIFDRAESFAAVVARCLRTIRPFSLDFCGITASPAAIMVQGFTDSHRLNTARDQVRDELRALHLDRDITERYRLEVAHMTVLRFRHPLRDPDAFLQKLEQMRTRPFGPSEAVSLELVIADWYMSRGVTHSLGTFKLGNG